MHSRIPRVSVVIPAYNQAHYLGETIESVLAQTYRDFEIIVVDDGSIDDSAQVAGQYGAAVRVIGQENQGLAGARNTGIRQAQGKLVALLDSDDAWLPTYLEKMVALADANPRAAVFYCAVSYFDAQGRELPQQPAATVLPPEQMVHTLLRYNFLVPSTILLRRTAAEDAGLFDPHFRRLQDWELWLRMLQAGYGFVGTAERLVRYRVHGDSLSTDPAGGQEAAHRIAWKLFGPEEGSPAGWPAEKRRMYGGVYRYKAITSLQASPAPHGQGNWEAAGKALHRALAIDPSLAESREFFYELSLGAQPIGRRGAQHSVDLEANGRALLEALSRGGNSGLPGSLLRRARATALASLALAAYHAGDRRLARRWAAAALISRPPLAASREMTGLVARTMLSRAALSRLRQLRGVF